MYVVIALITLFVISIYFFKYKKQEEFEEDTNIPLNAKAEREINKKKKLRERFLKNNKVERPSSTDSRVPLGQYVAPKWIVLDLLGNPNDYNPWDKNWKLKISGLQSGEKYMSLDEIKSLGMTEYSLDWHCVTGWTSLNINLKGVPLSKFIEYVNPKSNWVSLVQVSVDGYITTVFREDTENNKAFIALEDEKGDNISMEHGAIRIVFPELFGWKSAKFLTEISFKNQHTRGFWEKRGCHMRGRVEQNERWSAEGTDVWNKLIRMSNLNRTVVGFRVWMWIVTVSGRFYGWISQRQNAFKKK